MSVIVGIEHLGHGLGRVAQPRDLGDVHRQVAHPLEVGDHPQRGDEHPQVAGDRCLAGQDLEAVVLDPLSRLVDREVAADDVPRPPMASASSRAWVACDKRGTDAAGHLDELVEDAVELLLILIAHATTVEHPGLTRRATTVNGA